jgi:hypothetical protein
MEIISTKDGMVILCKLVATTHDPLKNIFWKLRTSSIFCDAAPYCLVDIYGRFAGTIYRVGEMKTEAAGSFETLYVEDVGNSFAIQAGKYQLGYEAS